MGREKYTGEVRALIEAHRADHTIVQLAEMIQERFPGKGISYNNLKCWMGRHKLQSGYKSRGPGTPTKLWPEEAIDYIKGTEYRAHTLDENLDTLRRMTGIDYTKRQLAARGKRLKARTCFDGRYKAGHVPSSPIAKGVNLSEKTQFKPGHRPVNAVPVGTEVYDTYGYKKRKVAEPGVWRYVHQMVWEEHNGPVPDGWHVIFLNGDKTDTGIDNLAAIPRNINCVMAKNHFFTNDRECTRSNILIARIMTARRRRRNGGQQGTGIRHDSQGGEDRR